MNENNKMFDVSILIVEDEDINRSLLYKILKRFIKNVDIASNGEEGLFKFKKNSYDILVTDIKMPIMSGLEMVSKIKFLGFEPFVILITAFNDKDYLYEAIKLRINNFIAKPVDMDELERVIIEYCNIIKMKEIYEDNSFTLQQYKNILDKSSIVIKFDSSAKIIYVNDIFEKISGFNKNQFLSNQNRLFCSTLQKKDFFEKLELLEEFNFDIKSSNSNNEEYTIKSFISPLYDNKGEIKNYILIGSV